MRARLVDRLAELSRGAGEPAVLVDRPDVTVIRSGGTVLKAHAPRLGPADLAARIRIAAHPLLKGILLAPLGELTGPVDGRHVSRWPYGTAVAPDAPEAAPWREAGRLTARLHAIPVAGLPGPLPPMTGPANAARAVAALRTTAGTPAPAPTTSPGPAPATPPTSPPGSAPTTLPGSALTTSPGSALTSPPGFAPTISPGSAPTSSPGSAPTSPPGSAPTSPPGSAPTTPPAPAPPCPSPYVPAPTAPHRSAPGPLPPQPPPPAPGRASAADLVLRAWEGLPAWARDADPCAQPRALLCHGDLHLGQLVRHPAPDGPWHLIDVDDLGLGEPAWDLARPAAGYATGLIPAADWAAFLDGYRAAGGPAVAPGGGLWPPEVDIPARALTVQLAARALVDAATGVRPLDDADRDLLAACARMAAADGGAAAGAGDPTGDGTRPGGAS
ncbi:phosphotransferase [Streptomyces sp. MAR4 CNX-425]|uniref:phosphotransferase n=1 Tax=Streptomyces sp. MAR4 CNX-425 TaxID=3406343 RepID=UPI003B511E21